MKPTWGMFGKILGSLTGIALFFFAQYNIIENQFKEIRGSIAMANTNIALIQKDTDYLKKDITEVKTGFANWQQRVDDTLKTWNIDVYEKLKKKK